MHISEYWGKIPFLLMLHSHILWYCPKKITFFENVSRNFTKRSFFNVYIIYDYFYGLYRYKLNENLLLILHFAFIAFILGSQAYFLIMELIMLFHDGVFVPNKKISEYVIDSEFYWKLKRHPFVLIAMYPFQ